MQQQTTFLDGARRLLNVVVEGYSTLNRRLWVLVIPIGLDLYLWLGPHISLRSLAQAVLSFSQQVPGAEPQVTAALQEWVDQSNLAGILASPLTLPLVPQLSQPARPGAAAAAWAPSSPLLLLLAGLGVGALLVLLWSLYLIPLADLVRGSRESGLSMLRRVPTVWLHMGLYCGLMVLAGAVFTVAASAVATVAALISPGLAVLVVILAGAAALWAFFLLFMVPAAVLLSGVGPLRAATYSVQVARTRLWSVIGFLLLVTVVWAGTTSLWQRLAGQPLLVLLGIVLNGYIVAGLAAAGLVFFREMLRDWLGRQTKRKVVQ